MSDFDVLVGDCREVMKGLEPDSVDSVVTSPPYAMQRAKLYGGIPEAIYPEWTVGWMSEVRRVLNPKGSVLINIREHIKNGEMSDYVHRTRMALRADGWIERDELIWDKKSGPPTGNRSHPRRSWERVLWFSLDRKCNSFPLANGTLSLGRVSYVSKNGHDLEGSKKHNTVSRCVDIARFSQALIEKGIQHPAAFPVQLAAWLVRLATPPNGLVLDPFTGSGSTGKACALEGFRFLGIEQSAEYADLARARIAACECFASLDERS